MAYEPLICPRHQIEIFCPFCLEDDPEPEDKVEKQTAKILQFRTKAQYALENPKRRKDP